MLKSKKTGGKFYMRKIAKSLCVAILVLTLLPVNSLVTHAETTLKEVAFFELADTEANEMYYGNPNEETPINSPCAPQAVFLPDLFLQRDYTLFKEGFNAANPESGTKDVDGEYAKPIWIEEFKGEYEADADINVVGYVSEDDFFVIKNADIPSTIDSFSIMYTLPVDDYVFSPIDFNVYFRPAGTCNDTDDTSMLTEENLSGTLKLRPTHDYTGGWHCYQTAAGDLNKQVAAGKYDIYIQVVANKTEDDPETKMYMGNFWEFRVYEGTVSGKVLPTAEPQPTPDKTDTPVSTQTATLNATQPKTESPNIGTSTATTDSGDTGSGSNDTVVIIVICIFAVIVIGGGAAFFIIKNKKVK